METINAQNCRMGLKVSRQRIVGDKYALFSAAVQLFRGARFAQIAGTSDLDGWIFTLPKYPPGSAPMASAALVDSDSLHKDGVK